MSEKVSIVIPVFNGSDYLREAIDSALNQTYKNIEVLVINDGSDDKGATEKIAKSFGKSIRYFKKSNGGVSSALNLGIKRMTGDWFSWLSHDDVYPKNRTKDLLEIYAKNHKVRFIYGILKNIDAYGKDHSIYKQNYDFIADKKIPLIRQMLKNNLISGCTTLIHKDVFKTVGGFNNQNKTAQDYEMWLNIANEYPVHRCAKVVVKRRVHENMGTVKLKPQVIRDNKLAITNIIKKLPIEKIYPDVITIDSSKQVKAECYVDLGDLIAIRWRWFELSKNQYKLAFKTYPYSKKAIIRLLIGSKMFHSKTFLREKVREKYWQIRDLYTNYCIKTK